MDKTSSQLEQELKFFQAAMDSACDGIVIADASGDRVYFNPSFAKMFEWPIEQMRDKQKRNIFADQQKAKEMFASVWAGETWSGEMLVNTIEGKEFYTMNHSNAIKNEQGEIIGIFGVYTDITEKKQAEEQLLQAYQKLQQLNEELEIRVKDRTQQLEETIVKLEQEIALKNQLLQENDYLEQQLRSELHFNSMIGDSSVFQTILQQVKLVAHTTANVLITGESGTGKELVARAIHENSDRKHRPLVKVNCASIPKELFESEFFGHIKGAFTGAFKDRIGRFELANGGTLFLDEVGEIPTYLQSKFLRVLQEGEFERLGEAKLQKIDVRIIAATNKDLPSEIEEGQFRRDLYYRLAVFPIEIPPLRQRKEDILPLVDHFIKIYAENMQRTPPKISKQQAKKLQNYSWPGNIRELKNVVERAMILYQGGDFDFILEHEVPTQKSQPKQSTDPIETTQPIATTLEDLKIIEKNIILQALEKCHGKIYGTQGAAKHLGIPPTTLTSKMKKLQIKRKWQ